MSNKTKFKLGNLAYTLVTVISVILIILVVLFANKPSQVEVIVGEAATETVYAPRSFTDEAATEKKKEEARSLIPNRYSPDNDKTKAATDKADSFFALAESYRINSADKYSSIDKLKANSEISVSEDTALAVMLSSDAQFSEMKKVSDIVKKEMGKIVSEVSEAQKNCNAEIDKLKLAGTQKDALKNIVSLVITENQIYDEAATEKAREEAAALVEEVVYKKNQTIITKGSIVTDEQFSTLMQLGLIKGTSQLSAAYTTGLIMLIIICYLIIAFTFTKQKKDPAAAPVTACCALLVMLVFVYGSNLLPEDMIYLFPAGFFVATVAVFSSWQLAAFSNSVLSVFYAVAFSGNWGYAICAIIAGTLTAYCFSAVKRRSHLLPATVLSALFYGFTFCAFSLMDSSSLLNSVMIFLKGFGGGFLSGLITIGFLPVFEWIFNATTPMKYSELASPENKLLKKLLVEAPGTYHHSLTVANISEIAARSIGANPLIARVGAYYHDIGKLRHPLYFKENQYDKNIHDSLSPEESSKIIIEHVTEGVELAEKNRLPQTVIDIISQHHGTTTTGYFLIRAREMNPDINEKDFTYPGPAPSTRESAIVMLADSCEAAVRSIDDKNEEKIESMVRRIATERVNSGQFSHCGLTFNELETVIRVITKTLGGYFHERIKYE